MSKNPPDTVRIGTYLVSLHDINFRDKEYTARFWLWMLYKNPEFDFVQQVEIPNAKSMEQPTILTDTINSTIYVLMRMKATMKQSWEVIDYPFDDQELKLHVENTVFDAKHLVFVPDTLGSAFDPKLAVDGWEIRNFKVSTHNNPYPTAFGDPNATRQYSVYSSFDISIILDRAALGLFLKIFLGMYIAFMIAIISFIIQPDNVEPRFGLPVGGLFAAVGNKYIIDSILPETSTFTLVDSLHSITFLFIFFTIAVSALSLIKVSRGDAENARKFDKIGALTIVILYLVINITLVTLAILH